MSYAVIINTPEGDQVYNTFLFRWYAKFVAARVSQGNARVHVVPNNPAAIIALQQDVQALQQDNQVLVNALWSLVSRDADGHWATVHEADTRIDPSIAEVIEKFLA